MLIEPVGTQRRGRAGRARALGTIAAPLVLLVAVVATGVLADGGAGGAAGPDADPAAVVGTTARTSAEPSAPAPVPATPQPATVRSIPRRALGLPTATVASTLDARRAGELGDRLVAIRGFLTIAPNLEACVTPDTGLDPVTGADAPWLCTRTAILRDRPEPAFTVEAGQLHWAVPSGEAYLHPTVFPGVSLGPLDEVAAVDTSTEPVDRWITPRPVIVIGRFDDPRVADRRASDRHPNEAFVIERLVWADGRWQDRRFGRAVPRSSDDLDLRTSRAIVAEAVPGGTVILSQTVVEPATLARLDTDASAAVRSTVGAGDRLWYVRVMSRAVWPMESIADDAGARRLGWVVLANDGTVLASEPSG